uniref:Glycosyltransferase subfamily 4-like N-terminal domain-containing protein n=1 Tax=Leersia perrieri TaxID=77586 RepID=A0A0D9WUH0_9ORYZ
MMAAAWNSSILMPHSPPPPPRPPTVATTALKPYSLHLHRRQPQKPLCLPCVPAASSDPAEDTGPDAASSSSLDSRPRRIALFVEPSPFAYVSGYKNRFQNFIKYLREMGDEVIVITTHEGVPQEFYGAKLIGSWSFPCPWYQKVPLSLALSPRIIGEVARFKPDIIHASSPGIMVFGALIIAKLLCVPLVMSYHTHVPIEYYGVEMSKYFIACLTACYTYIPFSSISNGEPEKTLILYVGRLGVEKSLDFLKRVMDRLPGSRIAFVGDGPFRDELELMFAGMPAVFTGTLQGEELSQAYACGDVFVMPSESETLGFVVLEAMSSGVPVVAARAGGIPDIIPEDQEGKTSFLYTPGDVDDCVSKIERLLTCEELRETMRKAARKEMEKFDWRAATRKIRNEQYSAAIWFWRKKRAQVLRPIQWVARRLFRPTPATSTTNQS